MKSEKNNRSIKSAIRLNQLFLQNLEIAKHFHCEKTALEVANAVTCAEMGVDIMQRFAVDVHVSSVKQINGCVADCSAEDFFYEWSNEKLPFPFITCLTGDLFSAYKLWCDSKGYEPLARNPFTHVISGHIKTRRDMRYRIGVERHKGNFFLVERPAEHLRQEAWLGNSTERFRRSLKD